MASRRCPHCGSDMFVAKIIRGAAVKTNDEGKFEILKETPEYEIELLRCQKCKEAISEKDLVELVKCSKCGNMVAPSVVNEKGECDICQVLDQRSDLAGASREDLLRMILNLEKAGTGKSASIQAKMDLANSMETSATVTDTATDAADTATETTSQIGEESAAEATTTTRKRRARKKTEDTADVNPDASEEETTETEENPAVADTTEGTMDPNALPIQGEDITQEIDAASQQAPFPETEDPFAALNQPQLETPPAQTTVGGFTMFEGDSF